MNLITVLLAIAVFFTVVYNYLIGNYRFSWNQNKDQELIPLPPEFVSILIAARNEVSNVKNLLQGLHNQDYPADKFEIILIDDHSEDETIKVASSLAIPNLKILQLSHFITERETARSYKKFALQYGIQEAQGSIILTTDADCTHDSNWLKSMIFPLQNNTADFVTGPVQFNTSIGILNQFQSLDLVGMMGVTNGGIQKQWHYMANGANMGFRKDNFLTLNGYDGNQGYASGDDMFLIQKFAKHNPEKVMYVKDPNAIVTTMTEPTWTALYWQRIRWATKGSAYNDRTILMVQLSVYLFHLSIIINLILGLFWNPSFAIMGGLQLFLKAIVDYGYLNSLNRFFKIEKLFRFYPLQVILHTLYIVVIGTLGNVMKEYYWKGRRTK